MASVLWLLPYLTLFTYPTYLPLVPSLSPFSCPLSLCLPWCSSCGRKHSSKPPCTAQPCAFFFFPQSPLEMLVSSLILSNSFFHVMLLFSSCVSWTAFPKRLSDFWSFSPFSGLVNIQRYEGGEGTYIHSVLCVILLSQTYTSSGRLNTR